MSLKKWAQNSKISRRVIGGRSKKRGQIALSASSFIAPTVPAWVFVCLGRVRQFFSRAWSQKMKELHGFTRIQSDIWKHKREIMGCLPLCQPGQCHQSVSPHHAGTVFYRLKWLDLIFLLKLHVSHHVRAICMLLCAHFSLILKDSTPV